MNRFNDTELGAVIKGRLYCLPETGELLWKRNNKRVSPSANSNGYLLVDIKWTDNKGVKHRTSLKQARVIYWLCTGDEPEIVDHINRNKTDNRLINLRASTHLQNSANAQPVKSNSTGYRGVTMLDRGKYRASIRVNGKDVNLGLYATPLLAGFAYRNAHLELYGEHSYWHKVGEQEQSEIDVLLLDKALLPTT